MLAGLRPLHTFLSKIVAHLKIYLTSHLMSHVFRSRFKSQHKVLYIKNKEHKGIVASLRFSAQSPLVTWYMSRRSGCRVGIKGPILHITGQCPIKMS